MSETLRTLASGVTAFLTARRASGLALRTVQFYGEKLGAFQRFCEAVSVALVEQLTPDHLRRFMLDICETHTPGGAHAFYRSVRAFLRWYEAEYEPDGWKNPLRRVPAPRVPLEPLEPVPLSDVAAMLATCKGGGKYDVRDRALLLALIDTGLRAGEIIALDTADVNLMTGEVLVKQGKGRKPRVVFLGAKARRAVRAYLRGRRASALFLSRYGERFQYDGLREVILRRARQAGIDAPALHDFRRAFALEMLRAGVDVFTLQRLMGHADLSVLRRYLAQTTDDLQAAHRAASPGDRL